jgi:hippurate hydrolase
LFPADAVYGMHNMPGLRAGSFAMRKGPIKAAFDRFRITVKGVGAHGAKPDQGRDPIVIGSEIVMALQTIVSRNLDPLECAVISTTMFNGGHALNVIPEEVHLAGGVRSFKPHVQEMIERRMEEIVAGICAAHGAHYKFDYQHGYPATINEAHAVENAAAAAAMVAGSDNVNTDVTPVMGSEDFAFMLQKKPGAYIFIGNGDGEGSCMIHNPHYDFNDRILETGVRYWVTLAEQQLAQTQ